MEDNEEKEESKSEEYINSVMTLSKEGTRRASF